MQKSKSLIRLFGSLAAVAMLVTILSIVGQTPAAADAKKGKGTYSMLCFTCHGMNGEGKRDVASPALTGLSRWYMVSQLKKFKNGQRGAHPDDVTGAQMAPMASTLANEAAMIDVSDYVRSLGPPHPTAQEVKGDVAKGGEIYKATCAECHGPGGLGLEEKLSSTLVGQNDWYMLAQLEKFKAGIRGTVEGDSTGAQMKEIADKLSETEMNDVLAFINTLEIPAANAEAK